MHSCFPSLSYKSRFKVISVGNITAGGSGKTPLTLYLAKQLMNKGNKVAIVLRGYKGAYENDNVLLTKDNVSQAGDEAMQYVHNLPNTPICVGKHRVKSFKILEKEYPDLNWVIMDDAFQHLQVKQDIKVCVFNVLNPIGNGFCLPAGILREPFHSVRYADYFVLNGDKVGLPESFLYKLKQYQKPILYGHYIISAINDVANKYIETESLKDKKLALLSGIGLPKSFERTILNAGLIFEKHICMNDHFDYTQEFLDIFSEKYGSYDFILTTEKDFSKLKKLKTELPLLTVKIKFEMETLCSI